MSLWMKASPKKEKIAEVKAIVDDAYRRCEEILKRDREQLVTVAEFLLKNETMSAEEFEAVFVQPDQNKRLSPTDK